VLSPVAYDLNLPFGNTHLFVEEVVEAVGERPKPGASLLMGGILSGHVASADHAGGTDRIPGDAVMFNTEEASPHGIKFHARGVI
jgi:hypothetical protein